MTTHDEETQLLGPAFKNNSLNSEISRSRSLSDIIASSPHALNGVGYVALSAVCFSLMSTLIKYTTYTISSMEAIFLRSITAFILNFAVIKISRKPIYLDTKYQKYLLYRSIAGFGSISFAFYAVSKMILADASVLIFTSPIITFFLGAFILKERIDIPSFICALFSFSGLLFVIRPTFIFGSPFDTALEPSWTAIGAALLGALGQAFSYIFVRKLKRIYYMFIIHYYMMFNIVASVLYIVLIQQQITLTMDTSIWLAAIGSGILTYTGQIFLTKGFQLEKAGIAAIMRYFDVVCVFLWDAFLLREPINHWSILGALIICTSAIAITLRKVQTTMT